MRMDFKMADVVFCRVRAGCGNNAASILGLDGSLWSLPFRVREFRDAVELRGAHVAGAPQAAERERRGRAGALRGLHEDPQLHRAFQPLQEPRDHHGRAQVQHQMPTRPSFTTQTL